MERRSFVKALAATTAAVKMWPEMAHGMSDHLAAMRADLQLVEGGDRWRRVRREFQLEPGLAHMNTGSVGAVPSIVNDAVATWTNQLEANPNKNTWGALGNRMEDVRATGAEFIGCDVDELALVRNCTEGMNQIATGSDLEAGDEVLTTNHEHGGGMVCWQHLRKHRGIKVNFIRMPVPVQSKAQFLERLEQQLTPRTKVVSLMHIDTITGMTYPMAEVAEITRPKGILLVCDGAQAPGMLDVDVHAMGVDAFTSSSHKWMLAPKGSGLLYIRKAAQDRIHPVITYSGFRAYSASIGTRDVPGILGHGLAMEFHNAIGRGVVEGRCRQLSNRLRRHLNQIERLRLLTPEVGDLSSGMVTYAVDGVPRAAISAKLYDEHNIIVKNAQGTYAYVEDADVTPEDYNALRFSTHIFNNEAEVDRLASLLADYLA